MKRLIRQMFLCTNDLRVLREILTGSTQTGNNDRIILSNGQVLHCSYVVHWLDDVYRRLYDEAP